MTVLKAIVSALLLIALLTPVITGYLHKRKRVSILLGWGLFVFACFSWDILVPMLALDLYGHEGVKQ